MPGKARICRVLPSVGRMPGRLDGRFRSFVVILLVQHHCVNVRLALRPALLAIEPRRYEIPPAADYAPAKTPYNTACLNQQRERTHACPPPWDTQIRYIDFGEIPIARRPVFSSRSPRTACLHSAEPIGEFPNQPKDFSERVPRLSTPIDCMAELSIALYEAYVRCGSLSEVAKRLDLPEQFVEQRVEAARLSLLVAGKWADDLETVVLASAGAKC